MLQAVGEETLAPSTKKPPEGGSDPMEKRSGFADTFTQTGERYQNKDS